MLCVSLLAVGLSGGERTGHENDPSCASPGRGDALRTVRKGIKSLGDRSRRFADKLESVTGFRSTPDNYFYNLKANHLMGGANLYIARELNRWFYLDLQGSVGLTKNNNRTAGDDRKRDLLYMGGLGLQFRFTPLLNGLNLISG